MTEEEAIHDLQVLIDFFQEDTGAVPMCLEYCLNMLKKGEANDEDACV